MFAVWDIIVSAMITGILAAGAVATWSWTRARGRFALAGLTTAAGFIAWNLTLNATNATGFDVDAPIVRISWQDAGTGVLVFTVTALVFGLVTDRAAPAHRAVGAAALAGLVALVFDVFFF